MLRLPLLFVCLVAFSTLVGCSSRTEPIYNVANASIPTVQEQLSNQKVRAAIVTALVENGWSIREDNPGAIGASLSFRAHRATISINYSSSSYSIDYRGSDNLLYDGTNIHRNYNRLIKELENAINGNLLIT